VIKEKEMKTQKKHAFDQMADLVLACAESIECQFPSEFPKLRLLFAANATGESFEGTDIRQVLRTFKLTDDFESDVLRFIQLVKDKAASAKFEADLEALPKDVIALKARKFVDQHGEHGTWQQMVSALAA
jgi:hypothetical protein